MPFRNVGAVHADTGEFFLTKKALKEAVASDPTKVRFFPTSMFDADGPILASDLQYGVKLSVVGPNPHRKRSWYSICERLRGGKLRVT